MPGRFSRIEFNHARRQQPATTQHPALGARLRSARSLLTEARAAEQWGDFERSLRLATRCLHEDRSVVVAWVQQVRMLVELDECHEARLWCDKALEVFRGHGDLLAAKAQVCSRLADNNAAAACSDASLTAEGSSPWRWQARGEVLLAQRQPRHRDCFDKALVDAAADWFDRVIIARILLHHRRAAEAAHYLQAGLALQPAHAPGWFLLGRCQLELGWDDAADASFARCLQLAPQYAPAQHGRDELDRRSLLGRPWRLLRGWWRR
ncbi:MAG: hypothetical protein WD009_11350 [Phycisphaeraceae bacterium]